MNLSQFLDLQDCSLDEMLYRLADYDTVKNFLDGLDQECSFDDLPLCLLELFQLHSS